MSGEFRGAGPGLRRGEFRGAGPDSRRGAAGADPGRRAVGADSGHGDFCGADALGRPGGPTRVAMRPCCVGALLGVVPPVRPEFPRGCAFLRSLLADPGRSLPAEPGSPLLAEAGRSLLAEPGSSLLANPGGSLLAESSGASVAENEPVTADARSEVLR